MVSVDVKHHAYLLRYNDQIFVIAGKSVFFFKSIKGNSQSLSRDFGFAMDQHTSAQRLRHDLDMLGKNGRVRDGSNRRIF